MNESEEIEEIKTFPLYPYCCKDSRHCPTVRQHQLDNSVMQYTHNFASPNHPLSHIFVKYAMRICSLKLWYIATFYQIFVVSHQALSFVHITPEKELFTTKKY